MSFRGTRGNLRGAPRVSQIFKKREDRVSNTVASSSNATLIGSTVIQETGTVYAVKLSLALQHLGATTGDFQRIVLWIRCIPADTGLPDLTDATEMETLNGFSPGCLFGVGPGSSSGPAVYMNEKFRFRRKCDRNTVIELLAESTLLNGTARVCDISGLMTTIIRLR